MLGLLPYGAVLLFSVLVMVRPWPAPDPARAGVAACYAALLVHSLGYAGFAIDPATWALLALGLALRRVDVRAPATAGDDRGRVHGGQRAVEADRGLLLPIYTAYLSPADYGAPR